MSLVFGKYEKIRRIAQGGMGEVFLARQTGVLDRLAILKALRVDLAKETEFVDQFLDEARVAATLNHPNIVAIYDVGEFNSTYYIAMEYIAGEDLSKLWYAAAKAGIGLPFQVSVRIIMEAALGLDHAHRARDVRGQPLNIVHRDVSPQNIMVRADGVTKLVDFGIAKAANKSSRTQAGMVKGKLQYMSPEQVRGEPLDGRSDQFSLGIVLWEMCTGRRLFKADNEINTLQKILQTPIPRPSQHVPGFPVELEAVIARMLERDPNKRFANVGEVAARLKEYLDRSSVSSGEVSVAAFVQQILGQELEDRIADLTPMESTEAAAPIPTRPSPAASSSLFSSAPTTRSTGVSSRRPEPISHAFTDDAPTVVLAPEKRSDRPTTPPFGDDGLGGLAVGPQGEWVVRRVDGKVVHFQEWATLQQWCIDGKLASGDQVSADGRRFTRLGDDVVLARFFSTAEAARRPAPVPLDPAPGPATLLGHRSAPIDTLPVGDIASVVDSPLQPPRPTTTTARPTAQQPVQNAGGSQADPFGPAPTGAFSLGALPTSHTGAWQFGTEHAALQAAAIAGQPTLPPTSPLPVAPPRKRSPVALWALLGVCGSLVVIGLALRLFAPETMRAILGDTQQVAALARTKAALTAIHSDEPATVEAMQNALQPTLGADADVDVVVAATLLAAERVRIAAAASALLVRGTDIAAADAHSQKLGAARAAAQALQQRLLPLSVGTTSEARWARTAAAIVAASPPASAEQLAALGAVGGDDVVMAREAKTWQALSAVTASLSSASPSAAALDAITSSDDDRRAAGLRLLLTAVAAASDDATGPDRRAAARRLVLTRQQRSPSDPRLLAAMTLLAAPTPLAAPTALAATTAETVAVVSPPLEKPPLEKPVVVTPVEKPAVTAPVATPPVLTPAEKPSVVAPVEKSPAEKPAEALETYETAYARGARAQRAGRTKEALRLLTTALELKPGDSKALLSLGWTQIDLARGDAALKSFRAVLEKGPIPEAQYGVGEALRALGRTTDAVTAFEKYLELAPNGPDAETAKNAIRALQ